MKIILEINTEYPAYAEPEFMEAIFGEVQEILSVRVGNEFVFRDNFDLTTGDWIYTLTIVNE